MRKELTRREFVRAVGGAIAAGSLGGGILDFLYNQAEGQRNEALFERVIEYRQVEQRLYKRHICTPMFENIKEFTISGDGEKVFVTAMQSPNFENTVAVYNAESGSQERSFVGGETLSTSNNGDIVAYETTDELSRRFGGVVEVVDINRPSSKPFRLQSPNEDSAYTSPRVSGTGTRLAVKKGIWQGQEHRDQMYLYNLTDLNAEPKEISQSLENRIGAFSIVPYPEISSDGRFVAFTIQDG